MRRKPADGTYEIEIPDSRKYRLRVNSLYSQMARDLRAGNCRATFGEAEHLREHLAQARLFINCVRQRWQTLERIALVLVDIQEEFIEKGYRYLKPLTRSELADIVGVHESTVGRAVANKSIMLPNDASSPVSPICGSLAVKCVIEEIVLQEQPSQRPEDSRPAQQRSRHSRRTVAKYRDAVGYPSPSEGRPQNRTWRPLWVPPEHAQAF